MEKETQKQYSVTVYVRRFDPDRDRAPRQQQYTIQVEKGLTVLDGLNLIKQTQDPTLGFRFSCRMGVCGSCGMLINGKPGLACNTQILDVTETALTLAPLPNFAIIRDLVPDLVPMFGVHRDIQPVHPEKRYRRNGKSDNGVLPDAGAARKVSPVYILHKMRRLHGRVPNHGHRRRLFGAHAPYSGLPLQRRFT